MDLLRTFLRLLFDVVFAVATFSLFASGAVAIGSIRHFFVSVGLDAIGAEIFLWVEWIIIGLDGVCLITILALSAAKCVRSFSMHEHG